MKENVLLIAISGINMRYIPFILLVIGVLGIRQLWHSSPSVETTDVSSQVNRLIQAHHVVVFSKTYCGFSKRAKSLLTARLGDNGFKVVEVDERADGEDMMDFMKQMTGARTVPRIFIGGKCIGGFDELSRLETEGRLDQIL